MISHSKFVFMDASKRAARLGYFEVWPGDAVRLERNLWAVPVDKGRLGKPNRIYVDRPVFIVGKRYARKHRFWLEWD